MTPLDRALRLLARKAYTALEMDKALAKAGVAEAERAEAVARLRELGYMDDLEVARARARTLLGRAAAGDKERRRAFRALVAKGHRPAQVARALGLTWEGDDS